ncbi:helix-turn-helix transcriptional regulator [Rouxiella sp. Mn2063]|uniref:helix-turn-helix transcriptional regulator n=1 Tax=Rouxiella sp. Mn2063 TaxID=3395262 RepID=UPI003BEA702D
MNQQELNVIIEKYRHLPIPFEMIVSWENSEEAWSVKNNEMQCIYSNKNYLELIMPEENKLNSSLTSVSSSIKRHQQLVIDTGKKIDAIGIITILPEHNYKSFYFESMPLYNKNAEKIGVITRAKELISITPQHFIFKNKIGRFNFSEPDDLFTKKEWEIIYLLLSGLSEKEISQTLNRSLRTIKFHKNNIFEKTQCHSIQNFKLKARKKQWDYYIPPSFVTSQYIFINA